MDKLIKNFSENHFIIEPFASPYHKIRTLFLWKYGCLLEIMGYFKSGNIRFALTQPKYNGGYPHQAKFFDNLQNIEFLGRKFKIPNYVEEFLEETYGKSWKTPINNKYDERETMGYWELVKDKIEI